MLRNNRQTVLPPMSVLTPVSNRIVKPASRVPKKLNQLQLAQWIPSMSDSASKAPSLPKIQKATPIGQEKVIPVTEKEVDTYTSDRKLEFLYWYY